MAGLDGPGHDARASVTVQPLHAFDQLGNEALLRLGDEHRLGRLLQLPLPPVNRLHGGQDVDAGGQPLLDQRAADDQSLRLVPSRHVNEVDRHPCLRSYCSSRSKNPERFLPQRDPQTHRRAAVRSAAGGPVAGERPNANSLASEIGEFYKRTRAAIGREAAVISPLMGFRRLVPAFRA